MAKKHEDAAEDKKMIKAAIAKAKPAMKKGGAVKKILPVKHEMKLTGKAYKKGGAVKKSCK
jgi:hypothetical protein